MGLRGERHLCVCFCRSRSGRWLGASCGQAAARIPECRAQRPGWGTAEIHRPLTSCGRRFGGQRGSIYIIYIHGRVREVHAVRRRRAGGRAPEMSSGKARHGQARPIPRCAAQCASRASSLPQARPWPSPASEPCSRRRNAPARGSAVRPSALGLWCAGWGLGHAPGRRRGGKEKGGRWRWLRRRAAAAFASSAGMSRCMGRSMRRWARQADWSVGSRRPLRCPAVCTRPQSLQTAIQSCTTMHEDPHSSGAPTARARRRRHPPACSRARAEEIT